MWLFVQHDVDDLDGIGDCDEAVAVDVALQGCGAEGDLLGGGVGVLVACLCGVDADVVGGGELYLAVVAFLDVVGSDLIYELRALCGAGEAQFAVGVGDVGFRAFRLWVSTFDGDDALEVLPDICGHIGIDAACGYV